MLEAYANAPQNYGEVSFYWWVGEKLTKERLLWQLHRLKDKHICALQINYCHSDTGGRVYGLTMDSDPKLFSDEWWELVGWFMGECKKHGIAVSLSDYTIAPPGQGRYMDVIREKYPEIIGKMLQLEDGEVVVKEIPYSVDPMNKNLGRYVIEEFYGKFDEHFPGEGGKGLNFFFSDELVFNIRGNLWNDTFAEEFKKRKGYDIVPELRAIFEDVGDKTEKIRLDYYDVIVTLCEEGYFIPVYNWNEERGMTFGCDHGGRGRDITEFGDYFRTQRWTQGPGNDQPNLSSDIIKAKVSSSISHLYHRPRTWLEGYYGSGWGTSTNGLLDATFRNFALGHNLLTLHGLYYTTYGGYWEWAPPCNHFRMPYWEHMDRFLGCVKRLSYLLTRGNHVCDVVVLYPVAALEGGNDGENAVKFAFEAGEALYKNAVDFDFIDFESLNRATVEGRELCVSGERYKMVVVPSMGTIRFENLVKLHAFSKAGGSVLFLNRLPEASERAGRNDPEVNRLVKEIANADGRVETVEQLLTLVKSRFLPDIQGEETPFILHRRIENLDVYFVYKAKQGSEYFFRAGGAVHLFDPWTGKERALSCIRQDADGTRLHMPLTETQVQVIVFNNQGAAALETAEEPLQETVLEGEWSFSLRPTLDNTYGDYSMPPTASMIGAQARFFRFTGGGREKEVMCTYETYFYRLDALRCACDEKILALEDCRDAEILEDGNSHRFKPYDFSMRYGVWMDPGSQGSYHGLKGKVTDEFLTFGKQVVTHANSNTQYEPEEGGSIYYFSTSVFCEKDGEYTVKTGSVKPARIYIDKEAVGEERVFLHAGYHGVLLRFDGCGRSFFILDGEKETRKQTVPLAMSWYENPTVLPFAPHYKEINKECRFCFTAPPGLTGMTIPAVGITRVLLRGEPLSVMEEKPGVYQVNVSKAVSGCPEIELIVQGVPGHIESAITGPVELHCGEGDFALGDWARIDGLRCYSGGALYRKSVSLQKHGAVFIHLGEVGCSAELFVNGVSAGVAMQEPYQFDISHLAVEGDNELEVFVYNTLENHYRTIPSRYNTGRQKSGLIGPVRVLTRG